MSAEEEIEYEWVKDNLDADNLYVNSEKKSINSELSVYSVFSGSSKIYDFVFLPPLFGHIVCPFCTNKRT